jgi:hypothetical protein
LTTIAAASSVAALVTVPFLIPYLRLRQLGFSARSVAETTRFAADVYAYLTADVQMGLWGRAMQAWPKPEGALFPGFATGLLAAVAVLEGWRRARREVPRPGHSVAGRVLGVAVLAAAAVLVAMLLGWSIRDSLAGVEIRITSFGRLMVLLIGLTLALLAASPGARSTARRWLASPVGMLAMVTVFAFAMSLGPQIQARGRLVAAANVYSPFHDFVPGYDGLRVPARFAMIVALGLAALAGYGAAGIARRRHGVMAVAALTAFILAESWAVPLGLNVNWIAYKQPGLAPLPGALAQGDSVPPVYRFIARLPAQSAIVELPFGEIAFETRYMFYSITHWHPLVNGYSGGAPDAYGLLAEQLKDPLDAPDVSWRAVRESRASYIVVHEGSYAADRGPKISAWIRTHGGREVAIFGTDHLFAVPD